jgi:hypothetical protein
VLEYFEDLIGSNKYVPAIEESYLQVENLNTQRQEKLNRVKHVEKVPALSLFYVLPVTFSLLSLTADLCFSYRTKTVCRAPRARRKST